MRPVSAAFLEKMPQDGPVTQFYIDGAAGGAGGGLIGGALASALMFFVGRAGAYLVFFSTAYYLYGMYYREILCVCGEAGQ